MVDFRKFITEAYNSGMNPDEFVKTMFDTAEKMKKEIEEAEKAKKGPSPSDRLAEMENTFLERVKEQKLDYNDVAALLTLVAAHDSNSSYEWTCDRINDFHNSMRKILPQMVKGFMSTNELVKEIDKITDKVINSFSNKSKEAKKSNEDLDKIINEFLRMFD